MWPGKDPLCRLTPAQRSRILLPSDEAPPLRGDGSKVQRINAILQLFDISEVRYTQDTVTDCFTGVNVAAAALIAKAGAVIADLDLRGVEILAAVGRHIDKSSQLLVYGGSFADTDAGAVTGAGQTALCQLYIKPVCDRERNIQEMKKPGLPEVLEGIDDTRRNRSVIYPWEEVLFIMLVAVVCGATSYVKVEMFGKSKESWFKKDLKLEYGIPDACT